LNKLDFPSPKDNLYQIWLNLVCWFWRSFFLNFQCIFTLSLLSPLGEGLSLESPLPRNDFVPSLVRIGPVVLEKKSKM
jgi:hypothetical protein